MSTRLEQIVPQKLILGSGSPRRKELLEQLGYQFSCINIDCEELVPQHLPSEKVAAYLSQLKTNHFRALKKEEILITADTVVCIENQILGKPKNKNEAKQMLKTLSNKTHLVYTAIQLTSTEKTISKTDAAEICFEKLTEQEIDYYVSKYEPMDKAGAYGIQEWLGMAKTKSIKGSFYTIMGLPTHLVYQSLTQDFKVFPHN